MTAIESIRRDVRICMFDLYGTVVDMQGGLTWAVAPYLKAKGWTGDPSRLVTWWRRTHFENSMIDALLGRAHIPYREIGRISLSYTLERAGIPHTQEEVRSLVAEIERLQPFPDAVAALARLKKKYRLVILSNGDPDMLEAIKPHLGIAFDRMISVAEAGCFKPHAAAYRKAAEILGGPAGGNPVRGEPRLRLRGRQGVRHARRVRRPPQAAVRRLALPARSRRQRFEGTR